jgi:hypothetical protein
MAFVAAVAALAVLGWPWLHDAAHAIPDAARAGNPWWGADARLIIWILAWDVHALLTQPLHLFDANIFYPARGTLAGSEHLLASAVTLFGPTYLATGNPVLAANVAAAATYVLAAITMYAFCRVVGLSRASSGVGAAALAFHPLMVPADLHVLQYPGYVLVLVLLAAQADRRQWLLGASLLAVFTSYYAAHMTAAVLGIELVLAALGAGSRRAGGMAMAAAPAFALLALASVPYASYARDAVVGGDPTPVLSLLIRVNAADLPRLTGFVSPVAGLAIAGLLQPAVRRRLPSWRWWRWLALVVTGTALLFGALPLALSLVSRRAESLETRAFRAFGRFGLLAGVGLAGLAAEGTELLLESRHLPAGVRSLGGALALVATATLRGHALGATPTTTLPTAEAVPAVYRWLARRPPEPVLTIPGPQSTINGPNAVAQGDAMYLSTFHWQPLINGYTGFNPWWLPALWGDCARLPDPAAVQAIVDMTGVRWIVVPHDRVSPAEFTRWADLPGRMSGIVRLPQGGPDLLLHVLRPPRRPWAQALAQGWPAPGRTGLGTPLAPLSEEAARGGLRCPVRATTMIAGIAASLPVRVANFGTATWPALLPPTMPDTGLVVVESTWQPSGGGAPLHAALLRLPHDVLPGDEIDLPPVVPPHDPGRYQLTLRLLQVGGASFKGSEALTIEVEVRLLRPVAPDGGHGAGASISRGFSNPTISRVAIDHSSAEAASTRPTSWSASGLRSISSGTHARSLGEL